MSKNKTIMNLHARQYIQAVFEKRLLEEGFHCPDDKLLCWYRMRTEELYDTVVFRSQWSDFPLSLDLLYEVSPMFFMPLRIPSVQFNDSTHTRVYCRKRTANLEKGPINEQNFMAFSPEIQVFAPKHDGRGIYAFDHIVLPAINQIHSLEESYQLHKESLPKEEDGSVSFWSASREFISEAIYMDDTEVYPHCRDRILRALYMYEGLVERKPNNNELAAMLDEWNMLYTALFEDGRAEFLSILEQRKAKHRKLLQKWGVIDS